MKTSKLTGRPFCFQPEELAVAAGRDLVLIGERQYRLKTAAVKTDEDWLIPLEDGLKLLAPDIEARIEGEKAVLVYEEKEYQVPVQTEKSETAMIGLKHFLAELAGLPCAVYKETFLVISLTGKQPEYTPQQVRFLDWKLKEKHVGELFKTAWLPEANRLNSYRLYVPSDWEKIEQKKMLIFLHGAGGNEDNCFVRSNGRMQYLAEKRGYLIFAPNSYVYRSNFGGSVPPSAQFEKPCFMDAEGNPQYYSEAELAENKKAQEWLVQLLDQVMEEYRVPSDAVILMGNSMGGIGTFHLGYEMPERFQGLIPCGAIPEPKEVDWKRYGDKEILYIAGTEDHNGYELMVKDSDYIASQGVHIRRLSVGGGVHSYAWAEELEAVFDFCDKLCVK